MVEAGGEAGEGEGEGGAVGEGRETDVVRRGCRWRSCTWRWPDSGSSWAPGKSRTHTPAPRCSWPGCTPPWTKQQGLLYAKQNEALYTINKVYFTQSKTKLCTQSTKFTSRKAKLSSVQINKVYFTQSKTKLCTKPTKFNSRKSKTKLCTNQQGLIHAKAKRSSVQNQQGLLHVKQNEALYKINKVDFTQQ